MFFSSEQDAGIIDDSKPRYSLISLLIFQLDDPK